MDAIHDQVRFLVARHGTVNRAARAAGFVLREGVFPCVGVYVPPPAGAKPRLLLRSRLHPQDERAMYALAVAHHALAHDRLDAYAYGTAGALYADPDAEREARLFAVALLRATRPVVLPMRRWA